MYAKALRAGPSNKIMFITPRFEITENTVSFKINKCEFGRKVHETKICKVYARRIDVKKDVSVEKGLANRPCFPPNKIENINIY